MSFKPTKEQEYCVDISTKHRVVKIEAGAGAAKTTTLTLVAKANPVKSIYLAFNKTLVEESKGKFPDWVERRTTHSLAYAVFGRQLQNKLKRPEGPYKNVCGTGTEIARHYRIQAQNYCEDITKQLTAAGMGIAIKETLARFEQSADEVLSANHVSYKPVSQWRDDPTFNKKEYALHVLTYAEMLWKERINTSTSILATHDTYLKLYQLSKPDLSQYEIIYLDESQDTSDCVIDIVKRQTKCRIILVGDSAQQIYAWRGATDAMKKFKGETGKLTTSFRFGPAVAKVAREILALKTEDSLDLKGWDALESQVLDYLPENLKDDPRCILYRTNAALIADGVEYLMAGKRVALEMDVKDFLNMMQSVVALSINDMKGVKHEEVVPYPSWDDLVKEVEYVGGDLARITRIVSGGQAGRVQRALAEYRKPEQPELILTTAHKSKGREFNILCLADDFPDVYNEDGEWVGLEDAEANLLYVAVTRTKKTLITNSTVRHILRRKGSLQVNVRSVEMFDNFLAAEAKSQSRLMHQLSQVEDIEEEMAMAAEDGIDVDGMDDIIGVMKMPEVDKLCASTFGLVPNTDHCF